MILLMAETLNKPVTLDQSPEQFFDQEKWQSFLDMCKSRESALHELTSRGPRIISFDTYDPNSKDSQRRRLRDEILKGFKAKLACGEIIARGIQPPSKKMEIIPAAIWNHLTFNFRNNTASGGKYEFIGIQLFKAGGASDSEVKITKGKKPPYQANRVKEWALTQKDIPTYASKIVLSQIETELKFRPAPKTARRGFELARQVRMKGK